MQQLSLMSTMTCNGRNTADRDWFRRDDVACAMAKQISCGVSVSNCLVIGSLYLSVNFPLVPFGFQKSLRRQITRNERMPGGWDSCDKKINDAPPSLPSKNLEFL